MAQTTSVLWSVDQGLGEDAKAQARQNIGAAASTDVTNKSEIKVFEGGTSSVHKNFMTIYEGSSTGDMAGITFNNENSNVTMVKTPAAGDGGKVLTVVEPGGSVAPYYEWKELESKIKHEFFFPTGGSDRQTILEVFKVPQLDGKWPTKIVGTFNCSPINGFTGISVLPLELYSRQLNSSPYTTETPTIFPDIPSPNWYISPYTSPGDSRIKNIADLTTGKNNTVNFALEQGNSGNNKLLKYIAIKGFATTYTTTPKDNYNISNLNFTYYYD